MTPGRPFSCSSSGSTRPRVRCVPTSTTAPMTKTQTFGVSSVTVPLTWVLATVAGTCCGTAPASRSASRRTTRTRQITATSADRAAGKGVPRAEARRPIPNGCGPPRGTATHGLAGPADRLADQPSMPRAVGELPTVRDPEQGALSVRVDRQDVLKTQQAEDAGRLSCGAHEG